MDSGVRRGKFLRCTNLVEVPESLCTLCLQTLVAPTVEALEKAESHHECQPSPATVEAVGVAKK